MSTESRTVEQWLSYGDDLAVKLAEVFTPEPWKHDIEEIHRAAVPKPLRKCRKCNQCYPIRHSSCSVPDPIDIKDWNTAKYWQGKCDEGEFTCAMEAVYKTTTYYEQVPMTYWAMHHATASDTLRAAAMAMDRSKG